MDNASRGPSVAKTAMRRSLHVVDIKGPSNGTKALGDKALASSVDSAVKPAPEISEPREIPGSALKQANPFADSSDLTILTANAIKTAEADPFVNSNAIAKDVPKGKKLTGLDLIPTDTSKSIALASNPTTTPPIPAHPEPISLIQHSQDDSEPSFVPIQSRNTLLPMATPHTRVMNTPKNEFLHDEEESYGGELPPSTRTISAIGMDGNFANFSAIHRTSSAIPNPWDSSFKEKRATMHATTTIIAGPEVENFVPTATTPILFGIPKPLFLALMFTGFVLFVSAVVAGIVFGTMPPNLPIVQANPGLAVSGLFVKNTQWNMQLFIQDPNTYAINYRVSTDTVTFSPAQNVSLAQNPNCNIAMSATSFESSDGTLFHQLFYISDGKIILANITCPAATPASCSTLQNVILSTKDTPVAASDASLAAVFLGFGVNQGWRILYHNDNYQVTQLTNTGGIWLTDVIVITNKAVEGSEIAATKTTSGSIELLYISDADKTIFTVENVNGIWQKPTPLTTTKISSLAPTSPLTISYASTPDTFHAFFSAGSTINEFIGINASSASFSVAASSGTSGRSDVGWTNTPDHDASWDLGGVAAVAPVAQSQIASSSPVTATLQPSTPISSIESTTTSVQVFAPTITSSQSQLQTTTSTTQESSAFSTTAATSTFISTPISTSFTSTSTSETSTLTTSTTTNLGNGKKPTAPPGNPAAASAPGPPKPTASQSSDDEDDSSDTESKRIRRGESEEDDDNDGDAPVSKTSVLPGQGTPSPPPPPLPPLAAANSTNPPGDNEDGENENDKPTPPPAPLASGQAPPPPPPPPAAANSTKPSGDAPPALGQAPPPPPPPPMAATNSTPPAPPAPPSVTPGQAPAAPPPPPTANSTKTPSEEDNEEDSDPEIEDRSTRLHSRNLTFKRSLTSSPPTTKRSTGQLLSSTPRAAAGIPVVSIGWLNQISLFRVVGSDILGSTFNGTAGKWATTVTI